MDFQRFFKRKDEGPAPANANDNTNNTSDSLNQKDVLVREGELLDGQLPPTLVWSNVGGVISIKADKLLGILEGRTRIRAAVLQELYPGLFEKPPNSGAEYNIPLQVVVTQLKDIFARISLEEMAVDDYDTPFGQLAREDEANFNERQMDRPEVRSMVTPNLFVLPLLGSKAALREGDQSTDTDRPGQPQPPTEELCSELERRNIASGNHRASFYARKSQEDNIGREGHVELQELYLTDEPLDGSKVANLVLQLPRVTDVVIMSSHGDALGGALSGGINETLLSLTPDFVKRLSGFTENIEGGPTKFITFAVQAGQISLSIGGDVFILAEHEGKNLPPGLRERLVATAQALDKVYSSQSR